MKRELDNWYATISGGIGPIKQLFDKYYPKEGVVLDIGGNVGAFTDYVISKYPNTEVHIFEPVDKFKDYLNEKYSGTSVTFVPKGLSNVESTAYIRCDSINLGYNEISNQGEEIPLTTLDNYIKENIKHKISFIKIDVEFYEPFVIEGMKKYIESTSDLPIIVIEHNYHSSPYKNDQNRVFEWLFNYYEEFDYKLYDYTEDVILVPRSKNLNSHKLPVSVGILSWHSGQTLVDTLLSYHQSGLLKMVNDVTILFQEITEEDRQVASHFGIKYIGLDTNVGIGKAFIELAKNAQTENVLLLEHDWKLVEGVQTTYERLKSGLQLLNEGYDLIRYRHRQQPGYPLFSMQAYQGNELDVYDESMDLTSPHLLDSIHWIDTPDTKFSDKIQKEGEYFTTTSRWGNWTNNPGLFKKQFYIGIVSQFINDHDLMLEPSISGWWARQNFKVAHGEGLFKHEDLKKFGR